jgi:hypothetical protein
MNSYSYGSSVVAVGTGWSNDIVIETAVFVQIL